MFAELSDGDLVLTARQKSLVPSLKKRFCERLVPVSAYGKHHLRNPFCADVVVPIDGQLDTLVKAACCHESQYFDWMYWPDNMEKASWPKEKKTQDLAERYDRLFARFRSEYAAEVVEKYGEKAEEIGHVEVFEICEYGEEPSAEFLEMLEK